MRKTLILVLTVFSLFLNGVVYAASIKPALVETFGNEGGYTVDDGGPTKYGISQRAYPNLDIKNLTIDQAAAIYQRDYWNPLNLDKEPSQIIANEIFDSAVNEGVGTAARRIQKAINLTNGKGQDIAIDGKLGPATWAAKAQVNQVEFYVCWIILRGERYEQLVEQNPAKFDQYFRSWLFRMKDNVRTAVHEYDAEVKIKQGKQ